MKKSLMTMMFINVPTMIGMIVTAEPLVELLFGSKWLPCAPILQVLCLAGLFWPLHTANLNVLMALGRSDLFFVLRYSRSFWHRQLAGCGPFRCHDNCLVTGSHEFCVHFCQWLLLRRPAGLWRASPIDGSPAEPRNWAGSCAGILDC